MERDQHTDPFFSTTFPPFGVPVVDDDLIADSKLLRRQYPAGPLIVSVLLHVLLLFCVFSLRTDPTIKTTVLIKPMRLHLLTPPLNQDPVPPQPPANTDVEEPSAPVGSRPVTPSRQIALPRTPVPDIEVEEPLPVFVTPSPTTLGIRQIVEAIRSEEDDNAVFTVCSEIQRRNPMLNCDDDTRAPFDHIDFGLGDEFFASTAATSAARVNAATMLRMARSLRDSGMSDEDIDRYLQDLDMTTRERATSGDTRATALKDQMFQSDSTYQLMKRVLNP